MSVWCQRRWVEWTTCLTPSNGQIKLRDGLLSRIRHPIRQTLFSSHFPIGVAIAACWCILKGASYKQAPCCLKWKHFLLKNLFCPLEPTVKLCVKISTPLFSGHWHHLPPGSIQRVCVGNFKLAPDSLLSPRSLWRPKILAFALSLHRVQFRSGYEIFNTITCDYRVCYMRFNNMIVLNLAPWIWPLYCLQMSDSELPIFSISQRVSRRCSLLQRCPHCRTRRWWWAIRSRR